MEILWKPDLVDDDTGAGWCLKRKKYTDNRHYWFQPFSDSSASRWKAENTKSFPIFKQEAILRFHFSYFPENKVVLTSSDTQLWGRKFPQLPMWKKLTHTSWISCIWRQHQTLKNSRVKRETKPQTWREIWCVSRAEWLRSHGWTEPALGNSFA